MKVPLCNFKCLEIALQLQMKTLRYEAQLHLHPQCFPAHFAKFGNYAQIKVHTTFSLHQVYFQGSFTANWTPDGHPLGQNVVYCTENWCSETVIQTEFL